MTLAWVVDEAFAALAEDIAAKQCQRLGQLGVFFLQLVVVRRGLIEHAFELIDAAFGASFGLLAERLRPAAATRRCGGAGLRATAGIRPDHQGVVV